MVMAVEVETAPIPSVKDLASSEASLRRKNLQQIITHLESRPLSNHLTHNQCLQLWRAFHVALYMHDSKNQLSVQTLIATMANTFKIIRSKDVELATTQSDSNSNNKTQKSRGQKPETKTDADDNNDNEDEFTGFDEPSPSSSPPPSTTQDSSWLSTYTTAFWETMAREWSAVDQWRMNKFLLLIRFALREIFDICLSSRLGLETTTTSSDSVAAREDESTSTTRKRKGVDKDNDTNKDIGSAKKSKKNKPSSTQTQTQAPSHSQSKSKSKSNRNPPNKHKAKDTSTLKSQLSILTLSPLSPRDRKIPDGLRLHMLDIYLDELFKTFNNLKTVHASEIEGLDGGEDVRAVLREMVGPVGVVAGDGLARHVRGKAKEVLREFEERVGEV